MHEVVIPNVHRWWVAECAEMENLDAAPEERPEADPFTPGDWHELAEAMDQIGRAMADQPGGSSVLVVPISVSSKVQRVVDSWIALDSLVCGDPHERGTTTNGRHRLRGAWDQVPHALLPLHSATLLHEDDARSDPKLVPSVLRPVFAMRAALTQAQAARAPLFSRHLDTLIGDWS